MAGFLKSKEIDAYKGIDATGKIAVVIGHLQTLNYAVCTRADYGKQGEDYMNPTDYARKVGVVGLIYIPDFRISPTGNAIGNVHWNAALL